MQIHAPFPTAVRRPCPKPTFSEPRRARIVFDPPTTEEIGTAAALVVLLEGHEHAAAEALGISRRMLLRWKSRPEYQAAEMAASLAADTEWNRWQQVAEERLERQRECLIRQHEMKLQDISYRRRRRRRAGFVPG